MCKQESPAPSAPVQTVKVCGKKCKHAAGGGCAKAKTFELANEQPLGVIRPVEPGNIQVDLPNGKDPLDTDEA